VGAAIVPNATLVDLVKIIIANTGTGTLQLGAPVQAFRGADALTDGETYSYSIQQGSNYEVGQGLYSLADATLTRGVIVSSYGNTAIPLSPNAVVAFPALATDFQVPGPPGAPGPAGGDGPPGIGLATPVNVISGSAHTIGVADANTYLQFTNASAVLVTVPTNADEPQPVGTVVILEQHGAGVLTITAAGGVVVNSRSGALMTAGQFAVIQLKQTAIDVWILMGDAA
jgi:hypothetical protein